MPPEKKTLRFLHVSATLRALSTFWLRLRVRVVAKRITNGCPLFNEHGASVVEVMFAIVIFMIIMIGGLNFFTLPQATNVRVKMKRLAVAIAEKRMETILEWGFTAISSDSNETSTPVTLAKITGNRNTTITTVDDAGDGTGGSDADSDTVDYKNISVDVTWNDGNNQVITLTTQVSSFGN